MIGLPTNYHHLPQKTRLISPPSVTSGPGTDLDGPGNIKYRTGPVRFLWIIPTLN